MAMFGEFLPVLRERRQLDFLVLPPDPPVGVGPDQEAVAGRVPAAARRKNAAKALSILLL